MKKLFIVSDVHSFYDEMIKALKEKGFDLKNPDHIFVSLGDIIDRGDQSLECLKFVNKLPKKRKILIKGNHETLMQDLIMWKRFQRHDYHNGTNKTVWQVIQEDPNNTLLRDAEAITLFSENPEWTKYIKSCVNYWEDDKNIFVHGWIPVAYELIDYVDYWHTGTDRFVYKDDWRDGNWEEARWINGMKAWNEGIRVPGKTIWCGHWHSSWGHCNLHNDGKEFLDKIETFYIDSKTGKQEPHVNHTPFKDEGIVAMDACTAISGIVNCEVIEIGDN